MEPKRNLGLKKGPQLNDACDGVTWSESTVRDRSWTSTLVPQELLNRVDENIRRMELGLEPIHVQSSDERELLRPKDHRTFGVQPDGSIRHCGNLIADLDDLERLRMNNRIRVSAGFPPENLKEIRELLPMSAAGQQIPSPQLRHTTAARESRRQHRAETIRTHGGIRGRWKLFLERLKWP